VSIMHCSFEPLVTLPPFRCVASWRRSVGPLREKREETSRKASKRQDRKRREREDGRIGRKKAGGGKPVGASPALSIRLTRLGGGNSFGGGGGTSIARPNQTLTHSLRKSASVGGRSVGRSVGVGHRRRRRSADRRLRRLRDRCQ